MSSLLIYHCLLEKAYSALAAVTLMPQNTNSTIHYVKPVTSVKCQNGRT
jgi:hypothetical protein